MFQHTDRPRQASPLLRLLLGGGAVVLILAALHLAAPIMAPVACAFVVLALVLPLQEALAARIPRPLAVVAAMLVTLVVVVAVIGVAAWGFGRVGQWMLENAARLQGLYRLQAGVLDPLGIGLGEVLAEQFDMAAILRLAQRATGAVQGLLSFAGLTLLFTLLGLVEAGDMRARLASPTGGAPGAAIRGFAAELGRKLRTYMLVRTGMSLLTGLGIGGFAALAGLPLALEWGVIAFALNYIPFLGPLVATLLPTALAGLLSGAWETAVLVFLGMNAVQVGIGSYLEPRLTGAVLAVSSFAVLLAVFLGMVVWGIAGAFLGTPALIALLTACGRGPPEARRLAFLLSGRDPG